MKNTFKVSVDGNLVRDTQVFTGNKPDGSTYCLVRGSVAVNIESEMANDKNVNEAVVYENFFYFTSEKSPWSFIPKGTHIAFEGTYRVRKDFTDKDGVTRAGGRELRVDPSSLIFVGNPFDMAGKAEQATGHAPAGKPVTKKAPAQGYTKAPARNPAPAQTPAQVSAQNYGEDYPVEYYEEPGF